MSGTRTLVLDAEQQTVRYRSAGVEIDPGGIGKGYAVDRMVAILREKRHPFRADYRRFQQYLWDRRAPDGVEGLEDGD